MGFFSKLGRTLRDIGDPGGTIIHKATGGTGSRPNNLASGLNPVAQPKAPTPPAAFDPGQRTGSTINGQSGVDQPSMRLGWTNGGYQYHNSPFNQQQGQAPPPQAPPNMGFGGASMGASGPQQMLQGPGAGGSMPPAGAQSPPMGPPTMQRPTDPQLAQAMMLRQRGGMM